MPSIVHNLILVIHILLAVSLVGIIVLMQRSEGGLGGLGGGGSGGMGGFLAGRTQANMITRTTGILAASFFITSLVLAYSDHRMGNTGPLVPASTQTAPATTNGQAPVTGNVETPAAPAAQTPAAPTTDSGTATPPAAPVQPAQPAQPAAPSGQ
ncbi:MAG TPA: preprotein translocase subunit SecG [Dongiaceae bacterium]|jgi:preprotein translocase subunit SecG